MKVIVEYIWMDGHEPTQKLRSKTKILNKKILSIADLPDWGFDGSSTNQAKGNFSDCLLKPVWLCKDPIRGGDNLLAMCEVMNPDGSVHASNPRARLRELAAQFSKEEIWFGIEQEYTFFEGRNPLGWPEDGYPGPQGPFYCGVGADEAFGREIVEDHLDLCLEAGLEVSGVNAEVMPGQWEYQIGPLGPLEIADQMWVSRWLLYRVSEDYGISATLHPKPVKGDWNGAGAHINFSTKSMREKGGIKVIENACEKLSKKHDEHIAVYGAHNEQRLTGQHETCSIKQFRHGVSDRGASIRIPMQTVNDGCGYLEDRRPAANVDPYEACAILIETTCS